MRKILIGLVAMLFISILAIGQTTEVTGKVTDSSGTALPNASITEKGTRNGVKSGLDGVFHIKVKPGARLVVSEIGFESTEVAASGNLNISLFAETKTLSEVVVTALGIKREKRELGISTQTVGNDQLNKSGSGNALSEMEGKVSGLTVVNSAGDPGSGTYIRLRGSTSIVGSNQPLIIIDGIPIDNSINNFDATNAGFQAGGAAGSLTGGAQPSNRGLDINPDDIESINVLKGPTAAALYGMQGANGVLVITTKKGSSKRGTSITFNSANAMDKVSQLPSLQSQFAQGSNGVYQGPETGSSTSWGPNLNTLSWDGATDYTWDKHGHIVNNSSAAAKIPVTPYDRYNFFQTGFSTNNNISISGTTDKSNYRLSLGNLYQTGIIPTSKYSKTTVSLSGDSKITDKLHATATINYVGSLNNKVQQGSNTSGVMLGLVRTPVTFDNANGYSDPVNQPLAYSFPDGSQRNYRGGGGYDNPYWVVNEDPTKSNLNRVFGNIQADYQLLKWMSLTYRLGGDVYTQSDKIAYNTGSNVAAAGAIYLVDYNNRQFNSDFMVNMHKTFGDDWDATLILGHNYFTNTQNTVFAQGTSLAVPGFLDISNANSYLAKEFEVGHTTMAYYAQAELNYKRSLYLTLTGRRETSSTLPEANNTFFYPSASLSWVFTELKGLKDNKVLSFGKIRASYADVAKDPLPQSLTTSYSTASFKDGWTNGINFPLGGVPGYQISSTISVVGNPNLKPENTRSYEFGVDLSFLKNRIGLNATAYYSKSTDVIFPVSIPYSTGFSSEELNAAVISNKGLEITLTTNPVKTKDLNWNLNFNWSRNISKVVSLYPGVDQFFMGGFGGGEAGIFAIPGQPFGVIYGATTPHTDLNNLNSPLLINDDKTDPGYAQPLAGGQGPNLVIGNPNPDWIGSIVNSLDYKAFTLGFQLDIKHGGQMWNGTRGALKNKGTAGITANRGTSTVFQGLLGHLDANGNVVHYDASGNEVAGAGAANTTSSVYSQYYWQNIGNSFTAGQETDIESAGFTRLRQVSLTCRFPKTIFGQKSFTNLSLTFFANNVILWTKYDGVDPETSLSGPSNNQGLDYFNSPGTKTYGVRLNLGL